MRAVYHPDSAIAAGFMPVSEASGAPSIVGLWKVEFLAKGNTNGIPDGALIDFGTATWHDDGTEAMVSGGRHPVDGDVCMGVCHQIGRASYQLVHLALSWQSGAYVGPAAIVERVTLDAGGNSFRCSFTITKHRASLAPGVEFDESTVLAPTPIVGVITGGARQGQSTAQPLGLRIAVDAEAARRCRSRLGVEPDGGRTAACCVEQAIPLGSGLGSHNLQRVPIAIELAVGIEVRIIAHDVIEAGRAWIALEFVAGKPIDEYCEQHRLPLRARVRLLAELAGAVAAAHRMLVVHRDIKPANVQVTADGVSKLIDFGIAAALQDQTALHAQTADLGRLFTPHYAAPEQVSGEPVTVTTDVFGLGALGYRLPTGQTLYPEARGAIGYLLAITRRDVDPPSRVLNAADPKGARELRGDLDAILHKALEREPAKRYASAADLQADLRRYLDDVPVVARAPSLAARIGKFARRNAVAVALASVSVVGLIVGLVAFALQVRQAAEARETSARRGEFLQELLKSANPRGGNREVTVAMLLDGSAAQIEKLVATEPPVGASMLGLVAESNLGLGRYPQGLAASARQIELLRAHGGNAPELAGALAERGELLIHAGNDAEAEAPLREALALVEHRRGAAKQLAAALEGLAKASQDLGREVEAEALFQRELAVYRSSKIDFGGQVGFPLSGLATIRHDQGRYAEAAAYMAQALEIERRRFPPDHPDLLDAEYNYAVTLEQAGRAVEAEPALRRLLASYRRILGPDHSDTSGAQQGLAHDLLSQKRYHEAAAEALPAAQGLARTLGDSDDWTLMAWSRVPWWPW